MATDKQKKENEEIVLLNPSIPEGKGGDFFEHYKLYLECIERVAEKREKANSFFLLINAALCSAFGFTISSDAAQEIKGCSVLVPLGGIFLNIFWCRLVASYRQLSTGKFKILFEMEKHLAMSPFTEEWKVLGRGKDKSKYVPLTHIERWIPIGFNVVYALLFLYLFLAGNGWFSMNN